MRLSLSVMGTLALALLSPSQASILRRDNSSECITPEPVPDFAGSELRNFGMVLYRAVDMIDVFGTLDPLQLLSSSVQQTNLFLIAETLDPVTTQPASPAMNPRNSSFWPVITPTHTFADDLDIDVLFVPGGPGMRAPDITPVTDYLVKMYPKVKIFMTICTGSGVAARSGVLDGHLATTNKAAWNDVIPRGPDVRWVSPARYVMDGKTWSSSGVSCPARAKTASVCRHTPTRLSTDGASQVTSALDIIFAFIETYWGAEVKDRISGVIEHVPRAADDDPFSSHFNVPPTEAQVCSPQS